MENELFDNSAPVEEPQQNLNDDVEFIDTEDIEDISDVYADEVIEEILSESVVDRSGDTSPLVYETYDDTNLRLQLDEFTDSFSVFSDDVSEKLDKMTSICIAIMLLIAAFVFINVFRKIFDWIGG